MSILKFVSERDGVVLGGDDVVLGDGGGYLAKVEVHGEDEHGELGGGGAGPERGGDGLGGGVGLGGGGGLTGLEGGGGRISNVGIGGGGGYLSGGDARGGGGLTCTY